MPDVTDRQILKLRDGPTILSADAAEVPKGTDCTELIAEMFRVMRRNDGMGLAAPQIGESLRIIIGQDVDRGWKFVIINPTIKKVRGKMSHWNEGCLSCQGSIKNRIRVPRYKQISVRGWSPQWEQITVTAREWMGRCLQHELDHLNGLCIDRFRNRT